MKLRIVEEGWWHVLGALVIFGVAGALCGRAEWSRAAAVLYSLAAIGALFMLYFFRDPDRQAPKDPRALVAGADGLIRAIEVMSEDTFLKTQAVRVSIFLSPLDVHVNRIPMGGKVAGLSYTPGKHLLTISNQSSEFNEHSSIYVEGAQTRCLVRQIVGPIVRRVVYWLKPLQRLEKGDRIGMMKFGSRLDLYFPAAEVEVKVKKGDRVRAGETVVATLKKETKA